MNYREAIKTAIEGARDDLDVGWRSRESRWRDATHVELEVKGVLRRGTDERRMASAGADDLQETIKGVRRLTVVVKCESQTDGTEIDTSETDGTPSGLELAELVSTHLGGETAGGILSLGNLGAPVVGPLVDVSYENDAGDLVSCWAFEVFFPTARTQTGALIGRVKRVTGTGTIKDADGTTTIAEIPFDSDLGE